MLLILLLNAQILDVNIIFTNLIFKLFFMVAFDGTVIKIFRNTGSYRFIRRLYNGFNSLGRLVLVIQILIETLNSWFSWIYFIIETEVFVFVKLHWIFSDDINVLFIWIFGHRYKLRRNEFLINNIFDILINSYRDLYFAKWLRIMIETFPNWCQWLNWLMIYILYVHDIIKSSYSIFSFSFNKSTHLNKNHPN